MERWKVWALAWLLAATLSALLLQAPSAQGDELLVNGGFEAELSGKWAVVTDGDVLERVAPPEPVHTGDHAGSLTCQAGFPCAIQQLVYDVGHGQEYELKAYLLWNESEVVALSAYVEWFDEQGSVIQRADAVHPCTVPTDEPYRCFSSGLQKVSLAARWAKVRVVVNLKDGVESTVVYLDDLSLTGPSAPTPTPSPSPPPTQTPLPTANPSPSPGPVVSPTPSPAASPSPTAVPTATDVPATATPSPSILPPSPGPRLVNSGFEEADDEGRPVAWRKYGGELRRSSAARHEGQFAAVFISRTSSTKWAFQTVVVEGGEAYVLSGYVFKNDANIESAYLRLSWYASSDGSGRAIDSVDSATRLTDDWLDFRLLTTGPVMAPAEAASAKVRLMLDPLSEAEAKVYFDDISFEETSMPPPTQTAVPSPSPEARQKPLLPPSDTRQGLATSDAAPTAPAGESSPPSSPTGPSLSPTVLGTTLADPEAAASARDGFPQSEAGREEAPSRTPVLLYRDTRAAQSIQRGEDVAAGADKGDGLSPIWLILAMTLSAVTAAVAALFVWRRAQKRARPR